MPNLRIGCVPYLNAKPLVDWFHSDECDVASEVVYAVPSELADLVRKDQVDVALVSSFELFRNRDLVVVPGASISADGPVKSVRLFSRVPFGEIRSVALDTSSLTSVALIRILLTERHGITPEYRAHPPDLSSMLESCDAGLIIGDLKLFQTPATYVMDLGEEWKTLTGLPFVYAAWLARPELVDTAHGPLIRAMQWGCSRLDSLAAFWSARLDLPLNRVRDYLLNVMQYDLDDRKWKALEEFQARCFRHGLIGANMPTSIRTT